MIALLLAAAACSGDCRAQSLFMTMERKLLSEQPALQLHVDSHATGAVKADASTDLSVGPEVRIHSEGALMGKPLAVDYDQPSNPGLRDAVIVGLARMGMLHNVVNLAQGGGIDHADKDVREWLKPVKFRRVKGGVAYKVTVDGKESGEATLLINAKTKLPSKRTLTVHFGNGDMKVSETYRFPAKR